MLVDVSRSMNGQAFPGTCDLGGSMRRIDAMKQLFAAFASRCMAYNYSHVVGVIKFETKVGASGALRVALLSESRSPTRRITQASEQCPLTHAWAHFVVRAAAFVCVWLLRFMLCVCAERCQRARGWRSASRTLYVPKREISRVRARRWEK